MGEVQDYSINKELRTEKFGISLTPVAQQSTIADPTDLATCITAITAIIDRLQAFGMIA